MWTTRLCNNLKPQQGADSYATRSRPRCSRGCPSRSGMFDTDRDHEPPPTPLDPSSLAYPASANDGRLQLVESWGLARPPIPAFQDIHNAAHAVQQKKNYVASKSDVLDALATSPPTAIAASPRVPIAENSHLFWYASDASMRTARTRERLPSRERALRRVAHLRFEIFHAQWPTPQHRLAVARHHEPPRAAPCLHPRSPTTSLKIGFMERR